MGVIHLITPEYFPAIGGVADYSRQIAGGLADVGEEVHVWCPASGKAAEHDRFAVHPELGGFESSDLAAVDRSFDRFSGPRRLLVQWVPHGFGRRAMNVSFCRWLMKRSNAGDHIELMVHEPYVTFWEGTWRQSAVAVVHRVMTAMLLRAATKVWVSVPAWETMWRPYAFGRTVPFVWLPIPSAMPYPEPGAIDHIRAGFGTPPRALIGHFGTFGGPVSTLLHGLLEELFNTGPDCSILLIGSGSDRFRSAFVARHPQTENRLTATGTLPDATLAAHVAACDLLIQPYPDGLTSRRTTAIGGLKLGVPIVSTIGYLTEPFWKDSAAVAMVPVTDRRGAIGEISRLLASPERRTEMSIAGRELYGRMFAVGRTVSALTGASPVSGRAA